MTSRNQQNDVCSAEIQALFICDQSLLLWGRPGWGAVPRTQTPAYRRPAEPKSMENPRDESAKRIWREEPA